MKSFDIRVRVGEYWCLEIDNDLDVVQVRRLADVEQAAREWISRRHRLSTDHFRVRLILAQRGTSARMSTDQRGPERRSDLPSR